MMKDLTRVDAPCDLSLSERVRTFIELQGGLLGGQIRVSEHDGTIVLDGAVGRYYDRQIALECAKHCVGVRHVVDRIAVREPRPLAAHLPES
jgi:osmotically-inducible protein OsmY